MKNVRRAVANEIAKQIPVHPGADRLLTMAEVEKITRRSRTVIWEMRRKDQFPPAKPLRAGGRAIGFLASDVQRWIAGKRDWGGGSEPGQGV